MPVSRHITLTIAAAESGEEAVAPIGMPILVNIYFDLSLATVSNGPEWPTGQPLVVRGCR